MTIQRRLKAEQARNERDRKTAEASLAELEQEISEALDLLHSAHHAYQQATEPVRRQLNQALFTRILIGPQPAQIKLELNEPYQTLTDPSGAEDA